MNVKVYIFLRNLISHFSALIKERSNYIRNSKQRLEKIESASCFYQKIKIIAPEIDSEGNLLNSKLDKK